MNSERLRRTGMAVALSVLQHANIGIGVNIFQGETDGVSFSGAVAGKGTAPSNQTPIDLPPPLTWRHQEKKTRGTTKDPKGNGFSTHGSIQSSHRRQQR